MTRKHFQAIADALKACKPIDGQPIMMTQWRFTVEKMADFCRSTNPNFDRSRFLRACGLE